MEKTTKKELFKELHFINRLSKILVREGMLRSGLKEVGHPYILKVLAESGDEGLVVSQKKFAKKLMVSPAAITQSIKRMDKEGLITKISDENDLRVNRIKITEKGRAFKEKMDKGLDFAAEAFFTGFTDEELSHMHSYAQRMINNISEFREDCGCNKESEH
jgi:DNA-binding MarR family transcriptional regulator